MVIIERGAEVPHDTGDVALSCCGPVDQATASADDVVLWSDDAVMDFIADAVADTLIAPRAAKGSQAA